MRGSGRFALRLGGSLVLGGSPPAPPPRFPLRGSAAGRTMLLKEYRICMPLTVDEVSARRASPAPGPPPPAPGCRVPRRRLLAGESTAGGREIWWNITFQTWRLEGKEGELLFLLVTPAGQGGVGWGSGLQVGPLGAPRIQITDDQNAPKVVGASPLSN